MSVQRPPAGPSLVQSAWSAALASLSIDPSSPASCHDAIQIAQDQSSLRTFLLTYHRPSSPDLPSSSGEQIREGLSRLRDSVSQDELNALVFRAISERIEREQSRRLRDVGVMGHVPPLLDGLRGDLNPVKDLAADILGDERLSLKIDELFKTQLLSKLTHAEELTALNAIGGWLRHNYFLWESDAQSATMMRDNLNSLGLNAILTVAVEGATRLHAEIQVRKLLQKSALPEHQEYGTDRPASPDLKTMRAWMDYEYEIGLDAAIRPLMSDFVNGRLAPAYEFWSSTTADKQETQVQWKGRFVHYIDTLLVRERAEDLFDLIKDWPASMAAMSDLKMSVTETREKIFVAARLTEALQKRLLHPGAKTKDILQIYVSLVYAVRFVDPSGILLSRVSGPLRRYLRGRTDTVPVIVASLLGDDEGFAQLREELDAAGKGEGSQNDGDTSMIVAGERDEDEADTTTTKARDATSSMRPIDYTDPNWEPRPVDAGPSYRQSRTADVIAMLVSIFDDKQSFVKALEVSTAKALLKTSNYNITREYRNNEVLKRRFGDSSLARCDVMLQDTVESRRVDAWIRSMMSSPVSSLASNTRKKLGLALEGASSPAFAVLRPLITSRQFWPDLEGSEVPIAPGGVNLDSTQPATLASVGPPPGGMDMKLPGELGRALDTYNRGFTAVRDSRRLRWLPGFGRVKVHVSMNDGRQWTEVVDPIKASVLTAAGELKSPEDAISRSALAEAMGLSEGSKELAEAFRYWCAKNVLVEVEGRAGWYIECEVRV